MNPRFRATGSVFLLSVSLLFEGLLFNSGVVRAGVQSDVPIALEPDRVIAQKLAGGETQAFTVKLEPDQFLEVSVLQKGIDLFVRLVGPDGKPVIKVDDTSGSEGTERLRFVSGVSGLFRVEVSSGDNKAPAGNFELRLLARRAANAGDRVLSESAAAFAQAKALGEGRKYDEAIAGIEKAIALVDGHFGPETLEAAVMLNKMGEFCEAKPDFKKAESAYQRALEIREKKLGPNHVETADIANNLALVHLAAGKLDQAEALLLRALAIYEKELGPDHLYVASAVNSLGRVSSERGAYRKAEPLYLRALAIRQKQLGTESVPVASSFHVLGQLYRILGDYPKAEMYYLQSLDIKEKLLGTDNTSTLLTRNNLALVYRFLGDFTKAEAQLSNVLAALEKRLGPEHPNVATAASNLAVVYTEIGAPEKAEKLYLRSLAIREKVLGPNHSDVALSLNNLAECYSSQKNYVKASECYQRAIAIFEKNLGPDHPSFAAGLNNLGQMYREMGDYAKAEPLYLRALDIRVRGFGDDHPYLINNITGLSSLYLAMGRLDQSVLFAKRVNDLIERDFQRNLISGSEQRKLLYLKTTAANTDLTVSLSVGDAPDKAAAVSAGLAVVLRRKGRALDVMSRNIEVLRERATPEDRALLNDLATAQSELANLLLRAPDPKKTAEYREQVTKLESRVDQLQGDIGRRSARFQASFQPVTLEAVQQAVPASAALVEYVVFRPFDAKRNKFMPAHYAAFVLTRTGAPSVVDLGETGPIHAAVEALRKSFTIADAEAGRDNRPLARALDELVMAPVRKLLGDRTEVLLSPDGVLNLVPFAALVDEHNRYLVERYRITYLSSGRDLLRKSLPGRASTPLVFADPDFGLDTGTAVNRPGILEGVTISRIPATGDEAAAIRRIFPEVKVRLRAEATETALKQVRGPRILHVATHGFFFGEEKVTGEAGTRNIVHGLANDNLSANGFTTPLVKSGLVMAGVNAAKEGSDDDGLLTALEAAGLDLFGTELVVLSACDSGVGEIRTGDGVYGLRRALVLAGSESQIISLWPVSDRSTKELMADFYTRLKAGAGRGEALRSVQLKMLGTPKRRHPYFWASFIESGDWGRLKR